MGEIVLTNILNRLLSARVPILASYAHFEVGFCFLVSDLVLLTRL